MTHKEALTLALEAIEMFCEHGAILRPIETRDAIKEALAQPEQEPVAWRLKNDAFDYGITSYDKEQADSYINDGWILVDVLYTTPPQRKPLTVEQRNEIARQADENDWHDYDIIDAVEAAHGIKGEA